MVIIDVYLGERSALQLKKTYLKERNMSSVSCKLYRSQKSTNVLTKDSHRSMYVNKDKTTDENSSTISNCISPTSVYLTLPRPLYERIQNMDNV